MKLSADPDVLVVGAGFAGAVMARELAERGATVVVVDRRPHVGGDAYDEHDADGILIHRHGPHLFTGAGAERAWLSRFTEWREHEGKALPSAGYTSMFRHILHHRRIEVGLDTSFEDAAGRLRWDHLVWTGRIDEHFGFRLGRLPYRSVRFEPETVATPGGGLHQPAAQIEHPGDDVPYTRSTEYRHFSGRRLTRSTIVYEYPAAEGEPFFPVHTADNVRLYSRYAELAAACPDVTFAGRLACYRYLTMDQVVAQSLAAAPAAAAALATRQAA